MNVGTCYNCLAKYMLLQNTITCTVKLIYKKTFRNSQKWSFRICILEYMYVTKPGYLYGRNLSTEMKPIKFIQVGCSCLTFDLSLIQTPLPDLNGTGIFFNFSKLYKKK